MFDSVRRLLAATGAVLDRMEEALLCLLLAAMMGLSCWQIALRYLFAGGLVWADPLLRYLVLWAGMFGAVVATRRGKHIAIDLITYLLPLRYQNFLRVGIDLLAATVAGVLTFAALTFVRNEREFASGSDLLGVPFWGWNLVFPVAFALITLRFLGAAGRELRAVLRPANQPAAGAKGE